MKRHGKAPSDDLGRRRQHLEANNTTPAVNDEDRCSMSPDREDWNWNDADDGDGFAPKWLQNHERNSKVGRGFDTFDGAR
jgi:hypothetical protein